MTTLTAIKRFRIAAGMTQQDLADALHVTQPAVLHWEKGRAEPGLDKIKAMAKIFGCSVDELLQE